MDKLSERLNDLAVRVENLEEQYATAQTVAREALEARIAEAKVAAEARRGEIADAVESAEANISSFWKELQTNYNASVAQFKSALVAGAGELEQSRALVQADDAEIYAMAALDFALLALADAEVAVMQAVEARAYAESLA